MTALLSLLVFPGESALAAPPSPAERAEALFTEAMELMASGSAEKACPMLEESLGLDPAMGTRYRLAECYDKTNRRVPAHALFREVADEARRAGMAEREARARERAAALEAEIAKIVVWVPPEIAAVPTLRVMLDGRELDRATWKGDATLVELGEHVLEATAEGLPPYRRVVPVSSRDEPVELSVPRLDPVPAPRQTKTGPRGAPPREAGPSPGQKAALVLGIGGAGAILASAGLAGMAMTTGGFSGTIEQTTLGGFAAGGVFALGGVLLAVATKPAGKAPEKARLALVPFASPFGSGATIAGSF